MNQNRVSLALIGDVGETNSAILNLLDSVASKKMQLECEQCGAPMREADLRLDRGIAVCARCGGVRVLPEHVGRNESNSANEDDGKARENENDHADQQLVPVPSRFEVENQPGELIIRWRWFHPAMFILLVFAIAWDSFVIGWYSVVSSLLAEGEVPIPFAMVFILFPLAHVAVGVGLTYYALSGLLNTTTVRVGRGTLSVKSGPSPTFKNVDLATDRIEQIYCENKIKKHADGEAPTPGTLFELFAVAENRKVKLLGWLRDHNEALFLEQQLERFLKIKNQPVSGEG